MPQCALYIEDFRRLLTGLGYPDYRLLSASPITIANQQIEQKIGNIGFQSLTVRVFKLDNLEDICEDYGQVAIYNGTLPEHLTFSNWTTIIALSMANQCWSVAIPQPWCRIPAMAATLPCMATGRPIMALLTVSRQSEIMGLTALLAVTVEDSPPQ